LERILIDIIVKHGRLHIVVHCDKIYLKFITRNNNRHVKCDDVVAAFYYDFSNKTKHYINFSHPDLPPNTDFLKFSNRINNEEKTFRVYVNNKKKYKYWLSCNLIDVNLFGFIKNNETIEDVDDITKNHLRITNNDINDFNLIIPYVIHQKCFDKEVELIKHLDEEKTDTYCFKFFNNVVTDTLYEVEKNGIKINKPIYDKFFDAKTSRGYVYTDYHIYNPTGRPSNCYDGINYVALKKDDGSRASFISRYTNGYLLMVDFTGFHPYIVANLIGYKVPEEETIYEHLAKQYYNTVDVTSETLAKSKKLTIVNLYGQISDQYLNIEFFQKTDQLKEKYWNAFVEKGYVTTPIYKRKITRKHVLDANKNKLFAYIIQATETEYGMDRLGACLKYVSNKEIVPILYNYDAILFDVGNVEQSNIEDLIKIIKNNKFKVKVYKGNNYNDLVQM